MCWQRPCLHRKDELRISYGKEQFKCVCVCGWEQWFLIIARGQRTFSRPTLNSTPECTCEKTITHLCAVRDRYTDMSNRRQTRENKRTNTGASLKWWAPRAQHFKPPVNTWVSNTKVRACICLWVLEKNNNQNMRLVPNLQLLIFHMLTDW